MRHKKGIPCRSGTVSLRFILSASVIEASDPAVFCVIREELPPYFLDQKSLDEVLDIINNRVSTIVAER